MTPKTIQYYETMFNFARTDYLNNPDRVKKFLQFCVDYDFQTSAEMWEVLFTMHENELASSKQYSKLFSGDAFYILHAKSEQKAIKLLVDNPVLVRALFQYFPDGLDETLTKIVADFVMGNKLAAAEEILKNLSKNTTTDKTYGEMMKMIVEKLLMELLKKMGGRTDGTRATISKKQSAVLLLYINKIKTPEKALLIQRLKEIS